MHISRPVPIVAALVAPLITCAALANADDARMSPVPSSAVTLAGPFWSARMSAVREGTLSANRHQCDITGRIANFEQIGRASCRERG